MKLKVINPLKAILIFGTIVFLGCQSPVTSVYHGPSSNASLGKGLTVSWSSPTTSPRTVMPSSFPTPSTYNISLTPTSGSPVTRTGVTSTSWTFSNLTPSVYAVTVVGLDGSGNSIVQGTASVDTTSNASESVSVTLNYALTGTGTGQINLTLNLASAGVGSTTASVKLVDPSGNVSSAVLSGSGNPGSNYTFTNASAAVGSWNAFFTVMSGTKTAMKMESILVFQNVPTTATLSFSPADFNATYVPVTSLALSKQTSIIGLYEATDSLVASVNAAASNSLLTWQTSDSSVVKVDQHGLVTLVAVGSAVVTVRSVDTPSLSAACTYTIKGRVNYAPNGALAGSTPVDSNLYAKGEIITVLGNSGNLGVRGGFFQGWNAAPDGTGSAYTASSVVAMGLSDLNLYAQFVPLPSLNIYVSGRNGSGVPAVVHNSSITYLPYSTSAVDTVAVCVFNGVVYTLGVDCYWVDSVRHDLQGTNVTASCIYFDGSSVYVGGEYGPTGSIPCYWKDGVKTDLTLLSSGFSSLKEGYVIALCTYSGSVYIVGTVSSGTLGSAAIWKVVNGDNGTLSSLSTLVPYSSSVARSVAVDSSGVYVCGYSFNAQTQSIACLWKDGTRSDFLGTSGQSDALEVQVENGNVYILGANYTGSSYYFTWKNGTQTVLSAPPDNSSPKRMSVFSGIAYVCSYYYYWDGTQWLATTTTFQTIQASDIFAE